MKRRNGKSRGVVSVLEIILLIASIFAFAHILGQSFPSVGAQEIKQCVTAGTNIWKLSGNTLTHISGPSPTKTYSLNQFCEVYSNLCTKGTIAGDNLEICPGDAPKTEKSTLNIPAPAFGSGFLRTPTISNRQTNILPGETGGVPDELDPSKCLTWADEECVQWEKGAGPAAGSIAGKAGGFLKRKIAGDLTIGNVLANAAWAAGIYVGIKFVGGIIPGINPALTQAVATSSAIGVFVGTTAADLGLKAGLIGSTGLGIAVAIVIFVFTYKEVRFEQVAFTCNPWVAPFGGENCQKCNNQEFPCTEYQCKSLGQDCELINSGTEDSLCVWNNPRDNKPPVINAWEDVLTVGYKYSPESVSSPPDRGVSVVNENREDGCVQPWERLTIGITIDEPAICKMSENNAASYEQMENIYWSGGISKQNHSFTFSLPSPEFLESKNISLQNGGEFVLYTRCIDRNEQANTGNFVFRYCVADADLTEPQIYSTSINNGAYVGFGQTEVPLEVYVNEPAECKWSRIDQDYDAMENEMSCSSQSEQRGGQIVFPCATTLTGLNDYPAENAYYFRCRDQPELKGTENEADRRTNQRSYLYTLLGSRSLVISDVGPNGTIRDSTEPIAITLEAETFAGAAEGAAQCFFSATGETGTFVKFINTGTNTHSQRLDLGEGDYTYTIKCEDSGGNIDEKTTSFTVETDTQAPIVVRAFHEGGQLKIITNEEANCVYSNNNNLGCTYLFEDGLSMQSPENNRHQTSWNPDKTFYIKCQDEFGNQPADPSACSIIVSPFSIK